jgi:hypothetical protein
LASILDALDVFSSTNEDDSIASELAAARSHAYIAFTQQPLLDFAVDDILTFDWQKLFALCFANNIPIDCGVEEQDLVNDLVLSLLTRQRELVASRILSLMASIQDGHEVPGGDSHIRITFREIVLLCHVLLALFALDLHLWSTVWPPRKRCMKTFWTPQAPKNMAN